MRSLFVLVSIVVALGFVVTPVCGMPRRRSTSLIASRVLAPTLPSGSPTS
jgi:hypothetical protein